MSGPKVDVSRKALIVVVCGSAGSGKSAWTKRQVRRAPRLVVWDIDDEYSAERCQRITSIPQLARALRTHKRGRFAYVGKPSDFEAFCKAAFAWGECAVVAEELADVTSPGKAPDGWGELVRRGRKRGISIFAVTQRPSESDKTIVGNASVIHVGRLNRAADRAYMAREMDIPQSEIDALKPLEWIEKHADGTVKRGQPRF